MVLAVMNFDLFAFDRWVVGYEETARLVFSRWIWIGGGRVIGG
jgi:hypothetical protein